MDKDQVIIAMDRATGQVRQIVELTGGSYAGQTLKEISKARTEVENVYAELQSLRAMRKRVEGLADEWSKGDVFRHSFFLKELRAALGDSHE